MIKNRLVHTVFLAGILFIALLTFSANAFAQDTHKVIFNGTNVTMFPEAGDAIPQTILEFQLTAETGYNLPATITVNNGTNLVQGNGDDQYTYDAGKITFGSTVDMTTDLTITAAGLPKNVATLATLTYSVTGGVQNGAVTGFTADNFVSGGYTVDLGVYQAGTTVVTLSGTATAESGAKVVATAGTIATGASIQVTAMDATTINTYNVAFTVAKAKILTVTEPTAQTFSQIYATFELAKAQLPQTMAITAQDGTTSLPLVWAMKSGSYDPASGAKNLFTWKATVPATLEANGQKVEGEVEMTNYTTPLSADNKLSVLTYQVPSGTATTVNGFANTDDTNKEYSVELPSNTAPTANITVAATGATGATFKVEGTTATSPFTVALVDGKKDFVLTVVAESGAERTVTIKFTTAQSTDNSLTALTYTVGTTTETVTGFNSADAGNKVYTVNTIPFVTKTVTVNATAAKGATIKEGTNTAATSFTVTLTGTTVVPLVLTVTSESGAARTVTINFSTVKDKITTVTSPDAPVLDKKLTETEVKNLLPAKLAITTEGESVTELPLVWVLKSGETFTDVSGEINIFTWKATAPASLDINGKNLEGELNVINALVPETGNKGDITVSAPAIQFGDGSTATTAETITVETTVKELMFNGITVNVDVTIPIGGTTTISLKGTNDIAKITNEGTLTLKNAPTTKNTSSIATRAVTNTGAVKAVINTGTFTDETGTVFTVGGANGLEITTLPVDQLNVTAASTTLTVAATAGATFQWKKNGVNVAANGTNATLTVAKADAGSYTCEVKNATGTAILTTPAVTVSFKGTTPPTPTTYVVSLPAVTGATFSKGVNTTVTEGEDFAFMITLDKDYNQSVPVVKTSRNEEIVPVAGVYTVSNVKSAITITVTGITKNISTGVDGVISGTRIWSAGNTLHIFTESTENVSVFNASGVLQKQFRTLGGNSATQLNEGLYIVKIGNYAQKVIIK